MRCSCEQARREARREALEEAAKIAERLTDSRDAPYFKAGNDALNCAARDIRALKAIASHPPAGGAVSPEKTTPGSPNQTSAPSVPPSASTGHVHDYARPVGNGWMECECGYLEKRETIETAPVASVPYREF
jgi:hypothetical protein